MTTWWCEHALVDGVLANAVTLRVEQGRFDTVEANTEPPAGAVTLRGLTVPGFANAHSHAFHRALRSRVQGERGTFWTWRETMYRAAERLNPDNYHRLARAVFGEMVQAGMTSVGEFHYVHNQPNGVRYDDPNAMGVALLAAAEDVGIRITLLDTLYQFGGREAGRYRALEGVQNRFYDQDVASWAGRVDDLFLGEGQKLGAGIHSVRAVEPHSMREIAAWAQTRGAPLHAHVSEQRAENEQVHDWLQCTPTELLESVGAMEGEFTAIHATHLTKHDIELLGSHRSNVCFCPTTERDLGDGVGPSSELAAAGVALGLGSDSHAVIDQMVEARAVELHQRLRAEQRGIHTAGELMNMATINGHKSLGWSDAGSIASGNRADLVTIDLRSERTAGAPHDLLVEAAVFASTSSDITSVIVDGRRVVSAGKHVDIDVAAGLATTIEELLS